MVEKRVDELERAGADLKKRLPKSRFKELMKRAAFLHREFIGIQLSNKFRGGDDGGGTIIHVYDTTILRTHTAPWKNGPLTGNQRFGFGQLLPRLFQFSDVSQLSQDERVVLRNQLRREDRLAASIARLLTDAALNRPGNPHQAACTYQFLGHYEETEYRKSELKHSVAQYSNAPLEFVDFGDRLKQYSKLLLNAYRRKTEGGSYQWDISVVLERFLEQVVEWQAANQFGDLFESAVLQELENRRPPTCLTLEAISKREINVTNSYGGFDDDETERFARSVLVSVWKDFLPGRYEHSVLRTHNDAEALAELAIINQRLFRNGQSCRVVFVTAHRKIVEKAYGIDDYLNANLGSYVARIIGDSDSREHNRVVESLKEYFQFGQNGYERWFRRFSLNYVRHLHAYARESFVDNASTREFGDLFSGLFAKETEGTLQNPNRLEEIVVEPDETAIPDNFKIEFYSILSNWEFLTKLGAKSQSFDSNVLFAPNDRRAFIDSLKPQLDKLGFDKAENDDQLEVHISAWMQEYVDRSRDRTMLQLSNLGTERLIDAKEGFAVRHPPDLHFLTLTNSDHLFRQLVRVDGYASLKDKPDEAREKFIREFKSIGDDTASSQGCTDDRQKCHLQFLALGAAFASSGRWQPAQAHAKRAIDIIERSKRPELNSPIKTKDMDGEHKSNMSGREAYFLDSTCYMVRASCVAELVPALCQLHRSRLALTEDRKKNEDIERPDEQLFRLRYLNQIIDILLAAYYFTRSACKIPDCTEGRACQSCMVRARALFWWADVLFASQAYSWISKDFPVQENSAPELTLTHLNVATSIIEISTITQYWRTNGTPLRDLIWDHALEEHLFLALKIFEKNKKLIETFNSKTYYLVGQVIRDSAQQKAFQNPEDLHNHFRAAAENSLTDFDPWRYERLEDFLMKRCGWAR